VEELKEAVFGILAVSLSSGVLLLFSDRESKMLSYIRYFLSLMLVLMLFSPLHSLLSNGLLGNRETAFSELPRTQDTTSPSSFDRVTIADMQRRTEQSVRALISAKTGIPTDALAVSLSLDDSDVSAIRITGVEVVVIGDAYRMISDKVCRIAEETLLCPCTLVLQNG